MGDSPFILTPASRNDLASIAHYTADKWGKEQALRYADLLDAGFHKIAKGDDFSKPAIKSNPAVRVCKCEHHYIFYLRPDKQEKPIIIAILHKRMDLMRRLKERLPK